jgi:hypothetical protein
MMNFFACPRRLLWKHSALLLVLAARLTLYHSFRLRELSVLYIPSYIIIFSFFSLLLGSG